MWRIASNLDLNFLLPRHSRDAKPQRHRGFWITASGSRRLSQPPDGVFENSDERRRRKAGMQVPTQLGTCWLRKELLKEGKSFVCCGECNQARAESPCILPRPWLSNKGAMLTMVIVSTVAPWKTDDDDRDDSNHADSYWSVRLPR